MSNASSIFNTTFFVILGIFIIVIGLMVIYFENKMREQNHKISSMLSLVSSLAEELNAVKFHLNHMNHMNMVGSGMKQMNNSINIPINSSETNNLGEDLIEVSDDEVESLDDDEDDAEDADDDNDDDEDDDNDDDDNDDDDDDDDDDDNDVDDCHVNNKSLLINKLTEDDIKILNIDDIMHNNIKKNEHNDADDDNDDDDDDDDNDDDDNDDDDDMIETFDIEDIESDDDKKENNVPIVELNELNEINEIDKIVLKSNIEKDFFVNLEKSKNIEVIDYKKLSLNKLKSIVLDKGLATDTSKMKKNDLLKLLGVE